MDWLQKLLGQLGVVAQQPNVMGGQPVPTGNGRGGTPPFMPQPSQQHAPQPQPQATPPPMMAPRPGYDSEGITAGMPNMAPHVNSRREQLEQDYRDLSAAPAEKQNKWLQGLFLAMQAGQRIADPMNQAGAYQSGAPIQWLGNAKKQAELQKIQGELAPLYEQDARRVGGIKAGLELEGELAKVNKTKAETAKIIKDSGRITSNGIVYERQPDGTWQTAQGIPAPRKIKVVVNGETVEMSPEEVYRQEQSNKRNTESANATVEAAGRKEVIEQSKDEAGQKTKFRDDYRKWEAENTKQVNEGIRLQNEGHKKRQQASEARAKGGEKEALDLETAGDALIEQGKALVNTAAATPPPKESDYPTYKVPPRAKSGKVNRSKDPLGLFN